MNTSEYKRQYYLDNREKILNQRRLYSEANKGLISQRKKQSYRYNLRKALFSAAKKRANLSGIEFNIELDDITIPEYCPILNLKLEVGAGKIHDASPSLDRIDSRIGYTKQNIQVISNLANRMKNSASFEQLIVFSEWVASKIKPLINKEFI